MELEGSSGNGCDDVELLYNRHSALHYAPVASLRHSGVDHQRLEEGGVRVVVLQAGGLFVEDFAPSWWLINELVAHGLAS